MRTLFTTASLHDSDFYEIIFIYTSETNEKFSNKINEVKVYGYMFLFQSHNKIISNIPLKLFQAVNIVSAHAEQYIRL